MERIRLLVVEDDVALANAMTGALLDYGYDVSIAHRVSDAIELLASDSFHVLIADWILERQLGKVVMEFARTSIPDLPIICFSAHATTDGECSHWADEFVLKSSTGADRLRSAIIRRLNPRHPIPMPKESSNGNLLLELGCLSQQMLDSISVELGKTLVFWCELPSLSRDLLVQFVQSFHPSSYVEIDCARPEFDMSQIVGRCELAGDRSKLIRGCLDSVRPNWCVLLNVDSLTQVEQKQLADIIGNRHVQRKGSMRSIPIECFVGFTANPVSIIDKELLNVVTQQVQLPSPTMLFGKRSESNSKVSERDESLKGFSVVSPISNHCLTDMGWPIANRTIGPQSIGPRVLIELLLNVGSDSECKKSWKDIERIAKGMYLRQVLSETNGNVSLASKWSGLRRNTIYEMLRDFELAPKDFRQKEPS